MTEHDLPAPPASPSGKPFTPLARLTQGQILKLSALWFGYQFFWTSMSLIVVPERVRHFVVDIGGHDELLGTYYGWLKAAGAVVVILTMLSVGFLSDHTESRLGRRRPFILSGTLTALVAIFGFLLAPGYWWMFAAYLAIEFAYNVASIPFQSLLPDLVPEPQHSRAGAIMGLLDLGGTLLGLISLIVMGVIYRANPTAGYMHYLFPAYLILILGSLLVVYFGIDEKGWAQVPQKVLAGPVRTLRLLPGVIARFAATAPTLLGTIVADYRKIRPQEHPNFTWLTFSRFLVFLGYHSFLTYVAYYTAANLDREAWLQSLGLPADLTYIVTPAMMVFFIFGGLGGNALSAPLSERFSKRTTVACGVVLAGLMVIPLILTHDVWVAIGAGMLLGMGWGAFIAADWAFACTLMPKTQAGSFMGIWCLSSLFPQVFSPVVAGWVRDLVYNWKLRGQPAPTELIKRGAEAHAHQWVFATILLYFAVSLVLLRNVREGAGSKQQAADSRQ